MQHVPDQTSLDPLSDSHFLIIDTGACKSAIRRIEQQQAESSCNACSGSVEGAAASTMFVIAFACDQVRIASGGSGMKERMR